jgi:CheY-like chemotaxis protein
MIPATATTAEQVEARDGERLLLSIDDDPSVAPLLEKMLAGEGYRVVGSTDPSRAVMDARRLSPAAILLDILMPGHDGRDILRDLKTDPQTKGIPVIVVTVVDAGDMPDLADGHEGKPVAKASLLRALEEGGAMPLVRR